MDFNHHPSHNKRYVILAICLLTGYVVGQAITHPTAKSVSDFIYQKLILSGHTPSFILSDRAPNLKEKEMKLMCDNLGIRRGLTARFNPRCNGKVERANGWFKKVMTTFVSVYQNDWSNFVENVCFIMNTAVSDSSGYSPHFLVYGREPRLPIDNLTQQVMYNPHEVYKPQPREELVELWRKARAKLIKAAEKWTGREDSPRKQKIFEPGDKVLIMNYSRVKGSISSFNDLFIGPYTVIRRCGKNSYEVVNDHDLKDVRVCTGHSIRKYFQRSDESNVESNLAGQVAPVIALNG